MALCEEAIVIDWRSLALRDEAIALCDPAVDMVLWKLAPINDILDNAACTSCNSGQLCCRLAAVSPPRKVLRSSDATCQRHKNCKIDGVLRPSVATPGIPSTQAF